MLSIWRGNMSLLEEIQIAVGVERIAEHYSESTPFMDVSLCEVVFRYYDLYSLPSNPVIRKKYGFRFNPLPKTGEE
jgi:hypothetical protein